MKIKENEPRIKFAKLEARKILKQLGIENPPIILNSVIGLLKKTNNIDVCKWKFGDNVDGIQITEGGSYIIGYNQERHVHRQRFTVAHEIGHFVLGHTKENYQLNLDDENLEQKEANAFAAELLIPADMLKKDIEERFDIKKLPSRYFVSIECLWWKIEEEKLLNKIMNVK